MEGKCLLHRHCPSFSKKMEIFYFLVNHLNPIVPYFIHIYCAFSFIIAGVLSIGDSKNVLEKVTILRRMNKRLFLVSVFLGYKASRCENLPYLVEQAQVRGGLRICFSVLWFPATPHTQDF